MLRGVSSGFCMSIPSSGWVASSLMYSNLTLRSGWAPAWLVDGVTTNEPGTTPKPAARAVVASGERRQRGDQRDCQQPSEPAGRGGGGHRALLITKATRRGAATRLWVTSIRTRSAPRRASWARAALERRSDSFAVPALRSVRAARSARVQRLPARQLTVAVTRPARVARAVSVIARPRASARLAAAVGGLRRSAGVAGNGFAACSSSPGPSNCSLALGGSAGGGGPAGAWQASPRHGWRGSTGAGRPPPIRATYAFRWSSSIHGSSCA